MSLKTLFIVSLTYGLILIGLVTLSGDWLVPAIPLIVYAAASLLSKPAGLRLHITRSLDAERTVRGQPVTVRLTVSNRGAALEQVLVEDLLPGGLAPVEGRTHILSTLPAGETLELSYKLRAARGQYHFPGVRVTASDHLDMLNEQSVFNVPGRLVVTPEVLRLKRANIRPRRTRTYAGLIPSRQSGAGVEFAGLREYQPGDPLRWINARASARHEQRLFVNEFEQERIADINLVLDLRSRSTIIPGAGSLLEHATLAMATLADFFIASGNRVGLFLYGSHFDWTPPGYSKVQRERILQVLARAEESSHFEGLENLPVQLFLPRSQIVFISPLLLQDAAALIRLRARGHPLLVFSPDPVSFEVQSLGEGAHVALAARLARLERALLLSKLRQAGAQVTDWQVDVPFEHVARFALSRSLHRTLQ